RIWELDLRSAIIPAWVSWVQGGPEYHTIRGFQPAAEFVPARFQEPPGQDRIRGEESATFPLCYPLDSFTPVGGAQLRVRLEKDLYRPRSATGVDGPRDSGLANGRCRGHGISDMWIGRQRPSASTPASLTDALVGRLRTSFRSSTFTRLETRALRDMTVQTVRRLNWMLDHYDGRRYLEVGVFKGVTFNEIRAERKVAVDPKFQFEVPPASPHVEHHEITS